MSNEINLQNFHIGEAFSSDHSLRNSHPGDALVGPLPVLPVDVNFFLYSINKCNKLNCYIMIRESFLLIGPNYFDKSLYLPENQIKLVYRLILGANQFQRLIILTSNFFFWSAKNSREVINKLKSRGFRATSLSTYDFSTLYTTLPHNLIKEKLINLIECTFKKSCL